ncbi:MAG: hypothetical protein AB7P17_10050 [Nitrospirales bacterium]|nr:hypothetical protein [Nitrospirales bacterium]
MSVLLDCYGPDQGAFQLKCVLGEITRMMPDLLHIFNSQHNRVPPLLMASLIVWFVLALAPHSHASEMTAQEVLEAIPLSDSEKENLQNGEIVRFTREETDDRELAVGMALLLKQTPEKVRELFLDAVEFQLIGEVTAFSAISENGAETDLSKISLEPNGDKEARRYLEAEPGETLNLSKQEIAAFQALNQKLGDGPGEKPAVEALIRQNLLARYQAYRTKGLLGITPYERGDGEQRDYGQELSLTTENAKFVARVFPSFYNILLHYPAGKTKELRESYHWLNIDVFGRPLLVLSHRMGIEIGEVFMGVDRHFYASHDYNGLQSAAGLLPVKDGTLLIYLFRISTDQVGGFGSSAKHPIARGLMGPFVEELFEGLRAQGGNK